MVGEAARTDAQAKNYFESYLNPIDEARGYKRLNQEFICAMCYV